MEELGKFKVCTDKGTYDAISLMPGGSQTEARNKYLRNVASLLESFGVFILASCNWTSVELKEHTKECKYQVVKYFSCATYPHVHTLKLL